MDHDKREPAGPKGRFKKKMGIPSQAIQIKEEKRCSRTMVLLQLYGIFGRMR